MENKIICLDTSILIEYFRKKNKEKSILYHLSSQNYSFAISVIPEYEIYSGSNELQQDFWNKLYSQLILIPLDSEIIKKSVEINNQLKADRKQIDIPDLFIGSSAVYNNFPLATKNVKHFGRIKDLILFDYNKLN